MDFPAGLQLWHAFPRGGQEGGRGNPCPLVAGDELLQAICPDPALRVLRQEFKEYGRYKMTYYTAQGVGTGSRGRLVGGSVVLCATRLCQNTFQRKRAEFSKKITNGGRKCCFEGLGVHLKVDEESQPGSIWVTFLGRLCVFCLLHHK